MEMNEQNYKILVVLEKLLDGLALDQLRNNTSGENVLVAIEILASMKRRAAGDLGISKEDILKARAVALKLAEQIYEESGMGKKIREEKAARDALEKKDGDFTKESWENAGNLATDAIKAAMRKDDAKEN